MDILKTAVLFLVFNRPDTTNKVFEKIRQAKPSRLYVAGDGPRVGYNEEDKVAKTREITTRVDWPCEVKTLFRDKNLGCKNGVSTAITWFFDHEEQGIILEDDCLPAESFFWYCLLDPILFYTCIDHENVGRRTKDRNFRVAFNKTLNRQTISYRQIFRYSVVNLYCFVGHTSLRNYNCFNWKFRQRRNPLRLLRTLLDEHQLHSHWNFCKQCYY